MISVVLLSSLFVSSFNVKTVSAEAPTPTIWLTVYRIQKIDPIENFLQGGADWFYKIFVWNGEDWSTQEHKPSSNNDDITVDKVHIFDNIDTTMTVVYIDLFEDDGILGTERADISGQEGIARFYLTYNLKDNTLGGDETIIEEEYYKTSGDYDGSIAVDENDANLWFFISDNYEPPKAEASTSKQTPYTHEKVNFDASASTASFGSSLIKFQWDFENDGIFDAEGETTSFTYVEKGKHNVVLKVTDNLGEYDTDIITINVLNREPDVSFTYSPSEPTIEDEVNFVDTSEDQDGTIESWSWDFGDGITSDNQNPIHQYSDKGEFTARLTVKDNDGATKVITKTVTVHNLEPVANFSFAPATPTVEETIQFADESRDPEREPLSCLWDFGDGYTSNIANPTHKYASAGTYNVKLNVEDDEEAESSITMTITIEETSFYEQPVVIPWWVFVAIALIVIAAIVGVGILFVKRRKLPR